MEVTPAGRLGCCSAFFWQRLVSLGIGYLLDRDDNVGRRLGTKGLRCGSIKANMANTIL
jgi:hypothetical protein